jgi:hypothetical protein
LTAPYKSRLRTTIQELQQFAADWAQLIYAKTAAASGGNIPRGKLLVGLVEIETPNPGSGLNSARSNSRKTMPMEAPSDPVDRQLFLDVFAKKDWTCCSSSLPLQRGQ